MSLLKEKIKKNIFKNNNFKEKNIDDFHIIEINNLFFLRENYNNNFIGKFIFSNEKEVNYFLKTFRKYNDEINKLITRKSFKKNIQIDNDIYLNGITNGRYFCIEIQDKKLNKIFRCYEGTHNSFLSHYILNELTIQGCQFLPEHLRGKGYADKAIDFAEELMGLKAVPHQLNHTTGSLSNLAKKSWEKRAKRKNVLGMNNDNNINERLKKIDDLDDLFYNETIKKLLLSQKIHNCKIKKNKSNFDNDTQENILSKYDYIYIEDENGFCFDPFPFKNEKTLLQYYSIKKENIIEIDLKQLKIEQPDIHNHKYEYIPYEKYIKSNSTLKEKDVFDLMFNQKDNLEKDNTLNL